MVHLWTFAQGDQDARRTAMAAGPAWPDFLRRSEKARPLIAQENRAQENRFLQPTEFPPG